MPLREAHSKSTLKSRSLPFLYTQHWLFFDKTRGNIPCLLAPPPSPHQGRVLALYNNRASQRCLDLFAAALLDRFEFKACKSSIAFTVLEGEGQLSTVALARAPGLTLTRCSPRNVSCLKFLLDQAGSKATTISKILSTTQHLRTH
ncbi:hypothetical protein CVT25_005640 [Psilocybe cyanescens]|uniref:Uncharacterized protein n=1 Tax=Psilocybe cyanescens TaxID=93625 RepID=A0A409X6B1_PSICY|nr:hypothetical protein CVT25_005640 [Psilocybe cyanescens]